MTDHGDEQVGDDLLVGQVHLMERNNVANGRDLAVDVREPGSRHRPAARRRMPSGRYDALFYLPPRIKATLSDREPVAFLLADLGVTKTHSRLYTSTDKLMPWRLAPDSNLGSPAIGAAYLVDDPAGNGEPFHAFPTDSVRRFVYAVPPQASIPRRIFWLGRRSVFRICPVQRSRKGRVQRSGSPMRTHGRECASLT